MARRRNRRRGERRNKTKARKGMYPGKRKERGRRSEDKTSDKRRDAKRERRERASFCSCVCVCELSRPSVRSSRVCRNRVCAPRVPRTLRARVCVSALGLARLAPRMVTRAFGGMCPRLLAGTARRRWWCACACVSACARVRACVRDVSCRVCVMDERADCL